MFSNFVSDYIRLTFILASVITTALGVKDEIHVDVAKDIPNNGHWTVDCDDGYQELTSGFDCRNGVDLPDEDNYGQRGFWTDCDSTCKIKYQVQLEDITFAARVYQTDDELTSVSFDGMSWEFYKGEGWIDIVKSLDGQTEVNIQMEHYSSDLFSVLDKIAINADLPPIEPVNPGPSTTEPTPPETTSWESKTTGLSNNEIHVDFEQDIPNNGNWDVDCDSGYREVVSAFNCTLSGRVELLIEDDYEQRGFWTDCDSTCKIKYHIQTEDTTFAMRVYQSHSHLTSISFDGMSWDFVQGEGWIDIIQSLNGQTEVNIQMEHLSPDFFSVLDRISVNGDLPPLNPRTRKSSLVKSV